MWVASFQMCFHFTNYQWCFPFMNDQLTFESLCGGPSRRAQLLIYPWWKKSSSVGKGHPLWLSNWAGSFGGGGRDAHGAVREEGDTHLSQPDQANLPWRSVGWHIPARSPSHPSVDSFNKDKLAHFVNSHLPNSKSHFILCFLHCKIYSIHILLYLSQIYFPLGCDFK